MFFCMHLFTWNTKAKLNNLCHTTFLQNYFKLSFYWVKISEKIEINLSEEQEKPKNKIAFATLKMPDGKEYEIPLPPKIFSSGREGYYAQIPSFVYEDEVYGGQIQVWKKTRKE